MKNRITAQREAELKIRCVTDRLIQLFQEPKAPADLIEFANELYRVVFFQLLSESDTVFTYLQQNNRIQAIQDKLTRLKEKYPHNHELFNYAYVFDKNVVDYIKLRLEVVTAKANFTFRKKLHEASSFSASGEIKSLGSSSSVDLDLMDTGITDSVHSGKQSTSSRVEESNQFSQFVISEPMTTLISNKPVLQDNVITKKVIAKPDTTKALMKEFVKIDKSPQSENDQHQFQQYLMPFKPINQSFNPLTLFEGRTNSEKAYNALYGLYQACPDKKELMNLFFRQ